MEEGDPGSDSDFEIDTKKEVRHEGLCFYNTVCYFTFTDGCIKHYTTRSDLILRFSKLVKGL